MSRGYYPSSSYYYPSTSSTYSPTYYYSSVGLQNLGNTCFMNSALQCLASVGRLGDLLLDPDIRLNNANPQAKRVVEAMQNYFEVLRNHDVRDTYAPRAIKEAIGYVADRFRGYEQHDAFELMTVLLTALADGLHQPNGGQIAREPSDYYQLSIEERFRISKSRLYARQSQQITDLFYGFQMNVVTCLNPKCGAKKIRFQPYAFFSVPTMRPKVEMRRFTLHCVKNQQLFLIQREELQSPWRTFQCCFPAYATGDDVVIKFRLKINEDLESSELELYALRDGLYCQWLEDKSQCLPSKVDTFVLWCWNKHTPMELDEEEIQKPLKDEIPVLSKEELETRFNREGNTRTRFKEESRTRFETEGKTRSHEVIRTRPSTGTNETKKLLKKETERKSDLLSEVLMIKFIQKSKYGSVFDKTETLIVLSWANLDRLETFLYHWYNNVCILKESSFPSPSDHHYSRQHSNPSSSTSSNVSARSSSANTRDTKHKRECICVYFTGDERKEAKFKRIGFLGSEKADNDTKDIDLVQDCLPLFTQASPLSEGSEWECDQCHEQPGRCTFQNLIHTLPKVLVIHLRRFRVVDTNWGPKMVKVTQRIKYDEEMDLADLLKTSHEKMKTTSKGTNIQRSQDNVNTGNIITTSGSENTYNSNDHEQTEWNENACRYRLVAVSRHFGSLEGGHYSAYARRRVRSRENWFHFNDSSYSSVGSDQVLNDPSALFLVYVNISKQTAEQHDGEESKIETGQEPWQLEPWYEG